MYYDLVSKYTYFHDAFMACDSLKVAIKLSIAATILNYT